MASPMKYRLITAKFLPDGESIQREVKRIFKTEHGRRVALVAFVGKHANAYLPRAKGIELICWPQAPGTNPDAIYHLMKKMKVSVQFADRLHMKIYWTATQGAVVTSANLSTNAYGKGALHEAGVILPSKAINIDDVIDSVNPRDVTKQELDKLRIESKRTSQQKKPRDEKTFLNWLNSTKRKPWLLHCFTAYGDAASERLRDAAKEENTKVFDWIYCCKGEVGAYDYILRVDLASRRRPIADGWLFVHDVVLVNKSDRHYESDWPYQAGQLHPSSTCPPPPFIVNGYFRKAIRATYKELGPEADKEFSEANTCKPSKRLLGIIEKNYRSASRR